MNIKYGIKLTLLTSFMTLSNIAESASMEETVKFSIVAGAVCKRTAEEVGGDIEAYAQLNIVSMQIAEKLGYTKDFPGLVSELKPMKVMLERELMKKYASRVDIYSDWCGRFYNGFQNGIARGYSLQ